MTAAAVSMTPPTSTDASTGSSDDSATNTQFPLHDQQVQPEHVDSFYKNFHYSHDDLKVLNLFDHPMWIFDIVKETMYWANTAALPFWNATSLQELVNRDYSSDMSETTRRKNHDNLQRAQNNERWEDTWTFYPKGGKPKSAVLKISGIHRDDGQLCILCEVFPSESDENEEEGDTDDNNSFVSASSPADNMFRRDAAMLRYLPMAVSQFDIRGKLMRQNPEACYTFGSSKSERLHGVQKEAVVDVGVVEGKDEDPDHLTNREGSGRASHVHFIGDCSSEIATNSCQNGNPSTTTQGNDARTKIPVSSIPAQAATIRGKRKYDSIGNDALVKSEEPILKKHHDNMETPSDFAERFFDPHVAQDVLERIKEHGSVVSIEALLNTKQGPEWNAIHATLGKDAVSHDPIILYSSRNIADIVKAKHETQINLERAEFFAIMAHEIRTPLFQVIGYVDLIDQTQLSTEQKGYIEQLKIASMGLITVINDVLDYSKLEAGKMKLDAIPFEPKLVLEGSVAAIAAAAEQKDLIVKSSFPASGVPVKLIGDPNRLRQILLNLLNNAVKFTRQGSIEASVEVLEQDRTGRVILRFAVKDSGIGIDSKHLTDIFTKYNQAAPAIATEFGGTGLGLSICKSLSNNMGGSIGVDSTIGVGSTFWVQIPFNSPPTMTVNQSPMIAKEDAKKRAKARNLKILVAEDNGVSQKLLSKMLSRLGHQATVVANGKEALNAVQEHSFDLVLMDIQMPVMDGIEATKAIRSSGKAELPIMGLTASVRREDFQDIGLNDWIGKPVRLKELQAKISSIM